MTSRARTSIAIAGLWALAVAHPILDVLARAPEFFVAHRADVTDALILAVALAAIGPLVLAACVWATGSANARAGHMLGAACVGLLGSLVAVQLSYRLGAAGWLAAALVVAVVAPALYVAWLRSPPFRTFLLLLSPAALVVPAVFLLTGPFAPSAAHPSSAGEPVRSTPVVLIVFDELSLVSLLDSTGSINAARYPHLAALARDGIWFRNATAVSDYTQYALPSILTGRYPVAASAPTPQDHPDTLFSLVARTHRVEALEAVTALCPRSVCAGDESPRAERFRGMTADVAVVAAYVFLPPAARAGLPDLTQNWANFGADVDADADAGTSDEDPEDADGPQVVRARRDWRRIWRAGSATDHFAASTRFVDGISAEDVQPTLYFMHSIASHHPARWLPSGQRIANRRGMPGLQGGVWTGDEWQVVQHQHAHLMQAGVADTLVGRLRDRLTAARIYDRALVIVTADHGASFRPNDRRRAFSGANAAELAPVPLIVKLPVGLAGAAPGTVDDRNAETIDILPTVADALDAHVTWPVDGTSLLASDAKRREKRFFYNRATMDERYGAGDLASRRDALVRRQSVIFGDGSWPNFTLPDFARIVGREITSFGAIGEERNVRVLLDRPEALREVDVDAAELPAQVTGRIRLSGGLRLDRMFLAIALNGTIVATTRAAAPAGRWTAMIPPAALENGRNELEVFVIEPGKPDRLKRASRP